jgi:hypothetical protein
MLMYVFVHSRFIGNPPVGSWEINPCFFRGGSVTALVPLLSYLVFMPKLSTHRMHDPGSIVPHIPPKVFTDNQISRIKYKYYISNVSKDYVNSQ